MHRSEIPAQLPVLIVGAGPTGLVLAIELARRGIAFRLIDRLAEPVAWSQAIFMKSRTLEILAGLGLRERLYDEGQVVEGVDVYADGSKMAGYRFAGLDTPFPHILSIPESAAIRILTEKLESLGGRIDRAVAFDGLGQDDGGVEVRLRSTRDGEHVFKASWVVGTDGYHSLVREAVSDAYEGTDYPERWGVFDTCMTGWDRPRDIVCAQLEPPIVIPFPLGTERWRIYFRTEKTPLGDFEWLSERLCAICPDARLVDPEEPQFFHAHSRLAHAFRIGRVFVAGDAAHASNPIEGHGMNAGIQDAWNLGWKLAAIVTGRASDALLDSYQAERRPVDRDIVKSGDEAYSRMAPENHGDLDAMFTFLKTAEGQDFAALAESEIAFTYAESPIVEEIGAADRTPPGYADIGCRVGNVSGLMLGERSVSLHELLAGTGLVAFLFPGTGQHAGADAAIAPYREIAADCPVELRTFVVPQGAEPVDGAEGFILRDPRGDLRNRLAGEEAALCVVRPDGHLGFRCRPPSADALKTHLLALFAPR